MQSQSDHSESMLCLRVMKCLATHRIEPIGGQANWNFADFGGEKEGEGGRGMSTGLDYLLTFHFFSRQNVRHHPGEAMGAINECISLVDESFTCLGSHGPMGNQLIVPSRVSHEKATGPAWFIPSIPRHIPSSVSDSDFRPGRCQVHCRRHAVLGNRRSKGLTD